MQIFQAKYLTKITARDYKVILKISSYKKYILYAMKALIQIFETLIYCQTHFQKVIPSKKKEF